MRHNRAFQGPFNYPLADSALQGRCKQSCKIQNNTYLQRRGESVIALCLHDTDVLTWYQDGRIVVNPGGYYTVTTKDRINGYLSDYKVFSGGRDFGPAWALYRFGKTWRPLVTVEGPVTIMPDGTVKGGGSVADARQTFRDEWNAIARDRRRARFWITKARVAGKLRKPLTLEMIQAEENGATRAAMIKVYGLERFLVAVGAKTIDTHGDYALLTYPLDHWRVIRALKMTCPSTQTVYIHPVEPRINTVSEALDWMFGVTGYLERLKAEA